MLQQLVIEMRKEKRKNEYENENAPPLKQPKLSRTKYESTFKIQQEFDDAMLEFFAMTFSPFNLANKKYLILQIQEFLLKTEQPIPVALETKQRVLGREC